MQKVERRSPLSNKFWLCCSFFIELTTCHSANLLMLRGKLRVFLHVSYIVKSLLVEFQNCSERITFYCGIDVSSESLQSQQITDDVFLAK